MSPGIDELLARLDVTFRDQGLIQRALIHRSYAFEHDLEPNERLEFLGDSVLALVVTDEIFHLQLQAQEGRLAKVRAAAVKTSSLARVARELGLGDYVQLGKGEEASGGADKDSILADTLEAVIGAHYLDQGFEASYRLVQRLFARTITDLVESRSALDFKTALQELAAAEFETLPAYSVSDEGPDHAKTFTASVEVAGRRVGEGHGRNKKEAEQRAAKMAHARLLAEQDEAGRDRQATLPQSPIIDPEQMVGTGGLGRTGVALTDSGKQATD